MKAVVYDQYGSPAVLGLKEVNRPAPKDGEVLIKVHAASINSWDWDMLTGKPYEYRLLSGLIKPKKTNILGCDVAGYIEQVGKTVSKLKPGDKVYGDLSGGRWGAFAEYACAGESEVRRMPDSMSFTEAAATPQAALLALQAFQTKNDIGDKDKVLINGGCGGVGTFAIQMAKALGAEITAVDSAEKLQTMRTLGADSVIDYEKEDFTQSEHGYDFILDVKSNRSISSYKRTLNKGGVYASLGGRTSSILQLILLGPLIKKRENKTLILVLHKPNKGLRTINELFESGQVSPVVDRCYSLEDTAEAFHYFGEGHFKGKVVVSLE